MSIYHEIWGLVTDEDLVSTPCWHSLCQYTDEQAARIIFEAIISEKINPGDQYDDFKFVPATPPKPKLTRQERLERRQRREARDARRAAKDAASGSSAASDGTRKRRRKAPRV